LKLGLDRPAAAAINGDVLRDFGSKAWGTPPGQTGGVYPFLGLENLIFGPSYQPNSIG